MAYVFRRPWRRARQPRIYRKPVSGGVAVNTIAPFTSAATGAVGHVGTAAETIAAFTSAAAGDRGSIGNAANVITAFISAADGDLGLVGTAAGTIDPFTSTAVGVAYAQGFTPGEVVGATNQCLQALIRSYLYQQYASDEDLQAFVAAFNEIAQDYLTWMNDTPLPIYTNPAISGALLDWVATGLYGVSRPAFSAGNFQTIGPFDTYPLAGMAFGARRVVGPAVYTPVSDDIYKRVLTWKLYKGDGKIINLRWLKRRVLRFLLGADGVDVPTGDTQQVSVTFGGNLVTITAVDTTVVTVGDGPLFNSQEFDEMGFALTSASARLRQTITEYQRDNQVNINFLSQTVTGLEGAAFDTFLGDDVPFNDFRVTAVQTFSPLPNIEIFKQAVDQGALDMPFQFKVVVNIR